ncbi:hypothetical protein C0995_008709 [Termitomyces sp. Mi166|nr:hypothetical protein C0995_008709 [Termitomyces sp. Mi166\
MAADREVKVQNALQPTMAVTVLTADSPPLQHSGTNVDDSLAILYNSLPSIQEANKMFRTEDRPNIFAAVAEVLKRFEPVYALSLIHAHCTIVPGEVMVARGNVCQPEFIDPSDCYPVCWLSDGLAPPQELLEEFRERVGHYASVLGLAYKGPHMKDLETTSHLDLEHTLDRANITTPLAQPRDELGDSVEAQWIPSCNDGVISALKCTQSCKPSSTRTGVHEKKTHTATD